MHYKSGNTHSIKDINPHKPGRPSHALHTYWVGNLRLVLDIVVASGLSHSTSCAKPGLTTLLSELSKSHKPMLVRRDCGFGNEPFILDLEQRNQSYLFKLKQTAGAKELLTNLFRREDWVAPLGGDQGWWAIEDTLKLSFIRQLDVCCGAFFQFSGKVRRRGKLYSARRATQPED